MIFRKKYLLYDDIVRGAGIGHTLWSYIFGLELSNKLGLEYLPCKIKAGHGLSDLEKFLGLDDHEARRKLISEKYPSEILNIQYNKSFPQGITLTKDWSDAHRKLIRDSYHNKREEQKNLSKQNVTNIAASIRRGDVVHYTTKFKERLATDEFYRKSINQILSSHNIEKYFINVFSDGAKGANYYVNENGEKVNKEQLLPEHYENAEINCSDHNEGNTAGSRNITFEHLQNCVNADIFLGSVSGFSELICVLRDYKNCYGPSPVKNKRNELIKCEK